MSERVAIVAGAGGEFGRATAEELAAGGFTQQLGTAKNRPYLTPNMLAHGVAPEAVAGIIVYFVSDAAAPVSGAVVPAYGA
jgi:hypothetical protein